jgi:hypothetical protein
MAAVKDSGGICAFSLHYILCFCRLVAEPDTTSSCPSTIPPLWSSGQSAWLLTQRSRVRFPALSDFLSSNGSGTGFTQHLFRINEELLERKVAAPVYKTEINDRRGSAALTTRHPSIHNIWHKITPTSGGRSVGIFRLRTKDHGVCLFVLRQLCALSPILFI